MQKVVHLRSAAYRNVHLRLDGTGVLASGHDGGTVNCQFGANAWETFNQIDNTDGTVSFESIAFPGVYLRLDATGVPRTPNASGGHVNGQVSIGPWEKYKLVANEDKTTSLLSGGWPNMFLRLDGSGVTEFSPSGSGTVNCEFVAGAGADPSPLGVPVPFPPQGSPGISARFVVRDCLGHAAAGDVLDQICQMFPGEATQIEANREHILHACCPPYATSPGTLSHLRSLNYTSPLPGPVPVPRDIPPCVKAIANVALDAIALLLSLFGVPGSIVRNMENVVLTALGRTGVSGLTALMENMLMAETLVEKAQYIWTFILQLRRLGVIQKVWDELRTQLRWWEWLYIVVVVVGQIAAWVLTDGLGFVAEIVLIIASLANMSYDIYMATQACGGNTSGAAMAVPSPA